MQETISCNFVIYTSTEIWPLHMVIIIVFPSTLFKERTSCLTAASEVGPQGPRSRSQYFGFMPYRYFVCTADMVRVYGTNCIYITSTIRIKLDKRLMQETVSCNFVIYTSTEIWPLHIVIIIVFPSTLFNCLWREHNIYPN